MSETFYLTTEQVVTINRDVFGCALGDYDVVDAAVNRCRSGFGGVEMFPTLWEKAYALLHGLSSTQGFIDGNKRTAWDAMETFLALNGLFVAVKTIQADVYVRAVGLNAIDAELAVEWLKFHQRQH